MIPNVPVIEELELKGKKYVRLTYGPSLTYIFPLPVYQYLVDALKNGDTLAVPVFSVYACHSSYATVVGPVKVFTDSIPEAGIYRLSVYPDETSTFTETPVVVAEQLSRSDIDLDKLKEIAKDYELTLRVIRKLDTYEKFEYINLGGRRCTLYHLKGLYFAKVLSGGIGAPQAFILTKKKLKEGSFVRGYLFAYKAGRADFYSSGTSHQVHYIVV